MLAFDRHGPLSECPISLESSFIKEYLALPEGSSERLIIERRYGLPNIRRLVAKLEEDRANQQWMKNSTTSCPSCGVCVEKSVGCNHVCVPPNGCYVVWTNEYS